MKLFGSFVAGLLALPACFASDDTLVFETGLLHRHLFSQYQLKYGKSYRPEEEELRFAAFVQNLDRVEQHNREAAEGKHTFTLAMNHLADLTDAEYRRMLGYRGQKRREGVRLEVTSSRYMDDVPTAWDWREHGAVGPVKNQGQCGSCWAFSAVAAMEGLHANKTGKIVQLSEQELVDCVNHGVDDCQHGGEMQEGFNEIVTNHGGKIESEDDYPYTAQSLKQCKADDSKAIGQFTGFGNVTSGDEKALLIAAYKRPVVAVAIDASSFMFQLYHSGVFSWPLCKNGEEDLDHGVAVVGYGTDGGKDYWIVKNSWGGSWGQNGYIWMSRNEKNQCGIATDASFPLWGKEGEL